MKSAQQTNQAISMIQWIEETASHFAAKQRTKAELANEFSWMRESRDYRMMKHADKATANTKMDSVLSAY